MFYFYEDNNKNLNIDILGELAKEYNKNPNNSDTWNIIPLGYRQAICNYDGYDIFLEYQRDYCKKIIEKKYNLCLSGHSHKALFGEDYMLVSALFNAGGFKNIKCETCYLPGFYIMNPLGDRVQIDWYYFVNGDIKQAPESKIYSLKK